MTQAYFLVADDIMDGSITRRGQPCWYRQPAVGMVAINDGIILEAAIYRILRTHFGWVGGLGLRLCLCLLPSHAPCTHSSFPTHPHLLSTLPSQTEPNITARTHTRTTPHPPAHRARTLRPARLARSSLPCYVHLLDLFHEVTYQTAHGQLLDTTTAPIGTVSPFSGEDEGVCGGPPLAADGTCCQLAAAPHGPTSLASALTLASTARRPPAVQVDLSRYTLDTYLRIVTYKTAFYTFYLPVACGLRLAGVT